MKKCCSLIMFCIFVAWCLLVFYFIPCIDFLSVKVCFLLKKEEGNLPSLSARTMVVSIHTHTRSPGNHETKAYFHILNLWLTKRGGAKCHGLVFYPSNPYKPGTANVVADALSRKAELASISKLQGEMLGLNAWSMTQGSNRRHHK